MGTFDIQVPSTTWRTFLKAIFHDHPEEFQRVVSEVGVSPASLNRWTRNANTPHYAKLVALYNALPTYQEELLRLIRDEFPDFLQTVEHKVRDQGKISSAIYAAVLRLDRDSSHSFWEISSLILKEALEQLTYNRRMVVQAGVQISIVVCMPPRKDGYIHTLWQRFAIGSGSWYTAELVPKNLLLGSESLAGYAVTCQCKAFVHDMDEEVLMFPVHRIPGEVSCAAYPIRYVDRIAGALLVSSTHARYLTEEYLDLIESYADLIRVAVQDNDFYPISAIRLEAVPYWEVQQIYWSNFHQRVVEAQRVRGDEVHSNDLSVYERIVGEQIETQILAQQDGHCNAM